MGCCGEEKFYPCTEDGTPIGKQCDPLSSALKNMGGPAKVLWLAMGGCGGFMLSQGFKGSDHIPGSVAEASSVPMQVGGIICVSMFLLILISCHFLPCCYNTCNLVDKHNQA